MNFVEIWGKGICIIGLRGWMPLLVPCCLGVNSVDI